MCFVRVEPRPYRMYAGYYLPQIAYAVLTGRGRKRHFGPRAAGPTFPQPGRVGLAYSLPAPDAFRGRPWPLTASRSRALTLPSFLLPGRFYRPKLRRALLPDPGPSSWAAGGC